jgi:two-component system, NarL family, nitrate/nitrite sensor histidine kinase NarX
MIQQLARRPILTRLGALMAAIVALGVISMLTSVIIAQTMDGMAASINQAGSLRMQSYRIGVALADDSVPAGARATQATALAEEFEDRLRSPRLRNAIPQAIDNSLTQTYARISRLWREGMRPPLRTHIELLAGGTQGPGETIPRAQYLAAVDAFVQQIDALVVALEDVAEGRVATLRAIQWGALGLTIIAVVVAMTLVVRRVIQPLQDLLCCADQARLGDFSGRTRYAGDDELGRLGSALNLMAESLSEIYGALEQRVAEKTRDLERSNQSLDLLYRTSKVLNEAQVSEPVLHRVLSEIQGQLGIGAITLCLQEGAAQDPGRHPDDPPRGRILVSTRPPAEQGGPCREQGCNACDEPLAVQHLTLAPAPTQAKDQPGRRILSLPVRDQDQGLGVLLVDLPQSGACEPWQERLLEALAGHVGSAINAQQRTRESRRLVLHEERTIMARELHDSLAQSLSYLKIQVTRLAATLRDPEHPAAAQAVLEELREGISSAYRQLRELLTTFRLKVDERGLNRALEETVAEFRGRSTLDIGLSNTLPASLLSPNEEIHVLQIVREALSNVVRHSRGRNARICLGLDDGVCEILIEDDGEGLPGRPAQTHHYGLTIMRERALSLGGEVCLETATGGGTRVAVRFQPRPMGTAPHTDADHSHAVQGTLH